MSPEPRAARGNARRSQRVESQPSYDLDLARIGKVKTLAPCVLTSDTALPGTARRQRREKEGNGHKKSRRMCREQQLCTDTIGSLLAVLLSQAVLDFSCAIPE